MSTHYRLQPPFLYVPEHDDFSKAWEHFCCKLLNISNKTTEVYVRNPPEQGIDLYFPSKNIAYQCKSVESGKSGDFNVTKVVESFKDAQNIQSSLGWKEYVLCTNVAISGKAEANLKTMLPDIKIFSNSYWVQLCESNPGEVERNFRRLIEIPQAKVLSAIHSRFVDHYSEELKQKIKGSSFDVFLYSNHHDTTYRVPIAEDFTCGDLLSIFRAFFRLPESADISTQDIRVSLSHAVIFKGNKVSLSKTVKEVGISPGDIITYWTTILWKDSQEKLEANVMHMITMNMLNRSTKSLRERKDAAIIIFKESLKRKFADFDRDLEEKCKSAS